VFRGGKKKRKKERKGVHKIIKNHVFRGGEKIRKFLV
jgi:hypothetical protein